MRILFHFKQARLAFVNPIRVISCHEPNGIPDAFNELERALSQGLYAAGFLSYEAGYAFEGKFSFKRKNPFPLFYFGIFEAPNQKPNPVLSIPVSTNITRLRLNMTRKDYDRNINRVRDYIAAGDVYQITYCLKIHFGFEGDPFSLYQTLLHQQPVPYAAYLETKERIILSLFQFTSRQMILILCLCLRSFSSKRKVPIS